MAIRIHVLHCSEFEEEASVLLPAAAAVEIGTERLDGQRRSWEPEGQGGRTGKGPAAVDPANPAASPQEQHFSGWHQRLAQNGDLDAMEMALRGGR